MEVPMHTMLKSLLAVAGIVVATQAGAQITFYEGEGFRGRAFTADGTLWNFEPSGFNDRAASVAVVSIRPSVTTTPYWSAAAWTETFASRMSSRTR